MTPREIFNGIESLIRWLIEEVFLPYMFAVLRPDKWLDVDIIFIIAAVGSYIFVASKIARFAQDGQLAIQELRREKKWWKNNFNKTWPFWYRYFGWTINSFGFVLLVPTAVFLPLAPVLLARSLFGKFGFNDYLWSGDAYLLVILVYWLLMILLIMRKGFSLGKTAEAKLNDGLKKLLAEVDDIESISESEPGLSKWLARPSNIKD